MTIRFQDLLDKTTQARRSPKVSAAGLYMGMGTEPDLWGQKQNRFKTDDTEEHRPPAEEEPPAPAVDEDQIAAELNLSDDLTISELKAIRRAFARENHPDAGVGNPEVRESRMKIANMIIDQQIQLRSRS